MARTIGSKWIRKVKKLTKEVEAMGKHGDDKKKAVIEILPEEVFDIWEGAYDEIVGIIWDTSFE